MEFSNKNIPRQKLIESVYETRAVLTNTRNALIKEDIKKEYPVLVLSEMTTTEYLLVHLAAHLT